MAVIAMTRELGTLGKDVVAGLAERLVSRADRRGFRMSHCRNDQLRPDFWIASPISL
jgi:hypothetical protein